MPGSEWEELEKIVIEEDLSESSESYNDIEQLRAEYDRLKREIYRIEEKGSSARNRIEEDIIDLLSEQMKESIDMDIINTIASSADREEQNEHVKEKTDQDLYLDRLGVDDE